MLGSRLLLYVSLRQSKQTWGLGTVSASSDCRNEGPQTGWLTEMYSFTVPEAGSPQPRLWLVDAPSAVSRPSCFLASSRFRGPQVTPHYGSVTPMSASAPMGPSSSSASASVTPSPVRTPGSFSTAHPSSITSAKTVSK